MTDKVANGSVEDVLSSIKRLVGEEGRKIPDLVPTSLARRPGRLVLTDALRVSETPEDSEQSQSGTEAKGSANAAAKPMLLRASDIVDQEDQASEESPSKDPADSLSAKIEALEAAIARTEDQWEPDGDSEDDYSGTRTISLEWNAEDEPSADESEATNAPEPEDLESKATFIRDPEVTAAAAAVLAAEPAEIPAQDEAALRELIAQVVREELQGVLGERITRNVRKMVRREIYRALAEYKPD